MSSQPDRPPKQSIGSIIKTAREAQGLSLGRLAERIDVSKGVVGDLETDRYKQPSAGLLVKIAGALEIDERQLLKMADYPYLVELPDLPVYLRTKYNLSDEALAHMKAQWEFARDHYGISDKPDQPASR